MNPEGWTQAEYEDLKTLLLKASNRQLPYILRAVQDEFQRRT